MLEWRVKPGDVVAVDDPLVEISTDKVDAELPSPVAGTVTEILVESDETVSVGSVLCRIAAGAGAPSGAVQPSAEPTETKPAASGADHEWWQRHARGGPHRKRPRPGCERHPRVRPARARDQGRRACRRRGQRRVRRSNPPSQPLPLRRCRGQAHPRPSGNAREVHEREPLDSHGHELPHRARQRARQPPQGAQGGRQEALVHPPDRLGDRAGRPRHAGDGPRLCRGGREAAARGAWQREPRACRGRGAQGRHALARGAGGPRRERAQLRRLRGALRRARGRRARQHASARRLPGREHHARRTRAASAPWRACRG